VLADTNASQTSEPPVPENADDLIARNLIETVHRLHADLDRIEFWTAALAAFQAPVPQYPAANEYLLRPHRAARTHN
jgi:hypothetical protein